MISDDPNNKHVTSTLASCFLGVFFHAVFISAVMRYTIYTIVRLAQVHRVDLAAPYRESWGSLHPVSCSLSRAQEGSRAYEEKPSQVRMRFRNVFLSRKTIVDVSVLMMLARLRSWGWEG